MELPELPFVACVWNDAWVDGTEAVAVSDVHLKHKASVHITTGWLLYKNDEGVSVANEFCPDDETYRGRTYIPAGMIVDIKEFKLTIPRKPRPKKPEASFTAP
ncbi:MAG: hypothetical protein AB7J46_06505 [Candidatus Altimarinota bacterium]